MDKKEVITLTFGDAGENHVGMEMIGKKGCRKKQDKRSLNV